MSATTIQLSEEDRADYTRIKAELCTSVLRLEALADHQGLPEDVHEWRLLCLSFTEIALAHVQDILTTGRISIRRCLEIDALDSRMEVEFARREKFFPPEIRAIMRGGVQ